MSQTTIATHTLGFPRIGPRRQLKRALEAYWRGESDEATLQAAARDIRLANWRLQKQAGIDLPASNDFSLYDHVLDTTCLVGALPRRFRDRRRRGAAVHRHAVRAGPRATGAGRRWR